MKSISDHPLNTAVAIRRNRPPTVEERAMIAAQIDSNMALIASLNSELEYRRKKLRIAAENLQLQVAELNRAQRHWEITSSYLSGIKPIATNLETTLNHLKEANTTEPTPSTNIDTIIPDDDQPMEAIGSQLLGHFDESLGIIAAATRNAESSYFAATESHQLAVLQRDLAESSIATILELIASVHEANNLEEQALMIRNIWKLPAEIWGQIFAEVVLMDRGLSNDDNRMPAGWMHGCRAMILAAVCQEWRAVAVQQKSLWTTINWTERPGHERRLPTKLYLERKGSLPYTLVLLMDSPAWFNQDVLKQTFLHRTDTFERLHLFVRTEGQELVCDRLYDGLPTPGELVLEAVIPARLPVDFITTDWVPMVSLPRPPLHDQKRLVVYFADTPDICQAALTHIEVHQTLFSDLHRFAPNAISTLEHAILRHGGAQPSYSGTPMTFPRLRYLETNLGLLVNRLYSVYAMPNLEELVITGKGARLEEGWKGVAEVLGKGTRVRKLVLCSMAEREVRWITSYHQEFPLLETLELRGDSVKPGLVELRKLFVAMEPRALGGKAFTKMKELMFTDYAGDGSGIVEVASESDAKGMRISIWLVNCPKVSMEVRRQISWRNLEAVG